MTASPIVPRELADHALLVARHRSRRGRPVEAWLRRSTSASYYAVFHALSTAVARQVAPRASDVDQRRLTRSVEHKRVAEVCGWVTGDGSGRANVAPIVRRLRGNTGLVAFATIFVSLQDARHAADYDHLAAIAERETLAHHQDAARALDLLEALRRTRDGQEFLALVALHTALR